MKYITERDIRLEFIIVDNSQINDCVERFNQILMRKVNTFLKNNNLAVKWWFELIHAVNYFRNIYFVTDFINDNGKLVISFQAFIERFYNYQTFRRIDQKSKYQIIKSATSYKKFDDYKASNVLIDYEKKHIYRIITEKDKIKRCFNVEWYNNLIARLIEKNISQKFSFSQSQFQSMSSSTQSIFLS